MILQSVSEVTSKPLRIISLVPSITELLYDLGLDEEVVGITKFCIHPESWQQSKTIIGGTKNLRLEAIKKLSPDIIIANKEENVKEQIEELAKYFNIWLTDVYTLEDALQMIINIGAITETKVKADELAKDIHDAFEDLTNNRVIKTCYLIWQDPYMTVGGDTYISNLMKRCGFQNIYADQTRYPIISISELKDQQCELLILSSEPYPFKQKHIDELQKHLPCTKIILADGEMFSWYGGRLLHAPKYFASLIKNI